MPNAHFRLTQAGIFAAGLLIATTSARAQFGASVSAQSDQRFRGVSLSDDKPQAQASLSYDANSAGSAAGWYGGASYSAMRFDDRRRSGLLTGYAGRVFALTPSLDAEGGLTAARFSDYPSYNYEEAYAGLLAERWSARLYFSPHYFGRSLHTVYAEFDANRPLASFSSSSMIGFAHLGALGSQGEAWRYDARAGVAWRYTQGWELNLAWVGATSGGPYMGSYEQRRQTVVLGAMISF